MMHGTILLNHNENIHQVEEEEKSRFLRDFLEQCFADVPEISAQIISIWNVDGPLPAPQKVKMRNVLTTYGIQVIDDLDGHLSIYLENDKVAEWYKPSYRLKRDFSCLDRRKQFYIEMEINCWSAFDDTQKEQETE
jgi:hypothetical protein